jgi:hypothetical protein
MPRTVSLGRYAERSEKAFLRRTDDGVHALWPRPQIIKFKVHI